MPTLLFIAILIAAIVDWIAVARGWKNVETIAKPGTMMLLFAWLWLAGGFGTAPLICFGLGLFFSLAGDIFLMGISNRWFLPGLVAFLLAHGAYIFALNMPVADLSPMLVIGIGVILAITAGWFLRRILDGLRTNGQSRLVLPVLAYGTVITLMLLSAVLTLFRPDWTPSASVLICVGAVLFYISDLILAWNKFVRPVRNGRVMNMAAYHLGQIGLIAGAIIQFAS